MSELTFYAKDTESVDLIGKSIESIIHQLLCLITTSGVEAIVFTPPSKKRSVQLLKELQKRVSKEMEIPQPRLVKYAPHNIIITQKSLKTREQRIQNAKQTILIADENHMKKYNNILLIDDFVGSGATLNETAKKIKDLGVHNVIGFAFVGNVDVKYEVINEI